MSTKHITTPLRDYVKVERVQHEASGIILGDTVKSDAHFDIVVVSCGPEVTDLKPGDMLVCAAGNLALPCEEKDHYLIKARDVVGTIKAVFDDE